MTHAELHEARAILPVQWFVNSAPVRTGEQRLMAAVLEDAITLYLERTPPSTPKLRPRFQHIRQETEHWIRSNDRARVFSFLRICDALGLEPQSLRRGLRMLQEQAPAGGRRLAGHAPGTHVLRAAQRSAEGAGVAAVLGTHRAK